MGVPEQDTVAFLTEFFGNTVWMRCRLVKRDAHGWSTFQECLKWDISWRGLNETEKDLVIETKERTC